MDNPGINYWVVKIKETHIPAGIITLIKRDYLEYYDIGFALLSRLTKRGYAYEATEAVLHDVMKDNSDILAITVKENIYSIRLLEKLGFRFDRELIREGETLQVYLNKK